MQKKLVSTVYRCGSGRRLGYAVQVVMKVLNADRRAAALGSNQIALQPFMLYNNCKVMFETIRMRYIFYSSRTLIFDI